MTVHDEVVSLCRELGAPSRDLAILGEGNASARFGESSMLVTTSGSELATLGVEQLVEVDLASAAALARSRRGFERASLTELAVPSADGTRRVPSIETLLHALVLERTDQAFIGHTHPTSVLALACSDRFDEAFAAPIFPDEVVICGPSYLLVPYASPGPALAIALDEALGEHMERNGSWPRAVILANHGLLAIGATPAQVLAITRMTDKSARIRAAALRVGGLRALSDDEVRALDGRPDEALRRRLLFEADE